MIPRLWVVLLLLLALAFGADLLYPGVQTVANLLPVATSALNVVPTERPTATLDTTPVKKPAVVSVATSTQNKKPKIVATSTAITKTIVVAPPTVTTPPPQPTQGEFDATAALLRGAIVNILCLTNRNDIHSISGSGVIVDPRGVIITNAHIAQYFLLESDPSFQVECVVRTGDPAKNAYYAKLMFISPEWVTQNAHVLTDPAPTGNGQYDFAFLAITKSASSAPLPTTFPFIPLNQDDPYATEPVVIGSYAAQFLTAGDIASALSPTVVFSSIKAIFTFVSSSIDVITMSGSAAAQEGSSGGGIARSPGLLVGIITTSTTQGDTASRTLAGITSSYIRRDYQTETGTPLSDLFANPPLEAVSEFLPQVSKLRGILSAALPK